MRGKRKSQKRGKSGMRRKNWKRKNWKWRKNCQRWKRRGKGDV